MTDTLKKCKCGDKQSKMSLIEKFYPILNKYSRKLGYEDAEQDLIEHFLIYPSTDINASSGTLFLNVINFFNFL